MHACLGVTCQLHLWQNDRGLLRATAVTRGWNGHRIRVSTQSYLWRRKFSRRTCRDSNSQPFDHESGALTTRFPGFCGTCPETAKHVLQTCQSAPSIVHFDREVTYQVKLLSTQEELADTAFSSATVVPVVRAKAKKKEQQYQLHE